MTDIAIVDYGMGNLRSVSKALEHVAPNVSISVTSDPKVVRQAGRVVVPGQGAMPECLRELDRFGLRSAVEDAATNKPFLGICLGLQMLFDSSEEGNVTGLGIVPGRVRRFHVTPAEKGDTDRGAGRKEERLKVPHMGWNQLRIRKAAPILRGLEDGAHMYFVHSFYVVPKDPLIIATETEYGQPFCSMVWKDNLYATQFHPEKSQSHGLQMLKNFAELA